MAQLTYHPCVVLEEPDITRFGFESPGNSSTPPQDTHCLWRGRDGAGRRHTLGFVPDHDDGYEVYERVFRDENPDTTRTLTLADRPAFVFFEDWVIQSGALSTHRSEPVVCDIGAAAIVLGT